MTEIIDRPRTLAPAMGRSENNQLRYDNHFREKKLSGDESCDLCKVADQHPLPLKIGGQTLEIAQKHIALIENSFPYTVYDGQEVIDHKMIVPKKHYAELKDFPPDVYSEYMGSLALIMQEFDQTFTRSPSNNGSSIKAHSHTHALKFGRLVEELSYSKNDGINLVRYRGEDWLHPL